jgi:aminomethyltransferase
MLGERAGNQAGQAWSPPRTQPARRAPACGPSGRYARSLLTTAAETTAPAARRTPLYERHQAAKARLVPFAGWEMPIMYEGIRQEHVAVRTHAGLFDVSHMGEIETSGPQAEQFLQRILSNDVTKIAERGAQYSVLCNEDGGVIDDLFTYRLPQARFLTVTNAANHAKDLAWFQKQAAPYDVTVTDAADSYAMLALQGPEARAILARHIEGEAPQRFRTTDAKVAGVDCLVAGTGYTGEDGVELLIPPDGATAVWDALTADGATPVGLGARDTLRLEVCFHLYGNDLSEDGDPITAGLGWCCKRDTGFIGSDKLPEAGATSQKLVPFAFTDKGIPRQGNPVHTEHGEGTVTSGTLSPCLDIGIGMAYLPTAAAEPGTSIEVDVRGKRRQAEVRRRPLYSKET